MSFKVGDKVKIRSDVAGRFYGITFTIEKLLVKNANLSSPHAPRGVRCPIDALIAADDVTANVTTVSIPWEPPLVIGTLVRFNDELYVVMAQNRNTRYRIVKLGGDGGRYFTNVLRAQMEVIDPAALATSV